MGEKRKLERSMEENELKQLKEQLSQALQQNDYLLKKYKELMADKVTEGISTLIKVLEYPVYFGEDYCKKVADQIKLMLSLEELEEVSKQ